MNLTHLRYLLEVERTGSITKAAQNLYMGQPNLSKAIKELEGEIGITVFKRTSRGVEPTRKGAEFLSYAHTIISQVDELESLYKPRPDNAVELCISVPRASYVSAAFAAFADRFVNEPHVDLRYKETSSMGAVNDVASGESDFAIVRFQTIYERYFVHLLREQELDYEPLWEFKMMLLMSETHPLAHYDDVPYHMLSGFTEIVHGDFQVPSLSFSQINKDASFSSPSKRLYIYDRGSQFELLRQVRGSYLWVSPMPDEVVQRNGLVLRHCALADLSNKDVIAYPRKRPIGEHGRALIDRIRREIDSIHG